MIHDTILTREINVGFSVVSLAWGSILLSLIFSSCNPLVGSVANSTIDTSFHPGVTPTVSPTPAPSPSVTPSPTPSPSPTVTPVSGPGTFTFLSPIPDNGKVVLAWNASSGAISYTINYGTVSGSYPSTFATGITGTSSTVTSLTNGTNYYFMVIAVNSKGTTTNATQEVSAAPGLPTVAAISNISTIGMSTSWTQGVAFTLGGVSSLSCTSNVTGASSNASVLTKSSISFGGTYPNCVATLSFSSNTTGNTTVTLTATYGQATASQSFVFTIMPAATAAYSLRKIVGGYTGKAVNVCLTSSCTSTQDIGFTASGSLDSSALTSFCGASSCFVGTWYDQSGNVSNATQGTTSKQPQIVNSGTVNTVNSQPILIFNGTSDSMTATAVSIVSTWTINAVNKWLTFPNDTDHIMFSGSPTANLSIRSNGGTSTLLVYNGNGAVTANILDNTTLHVWTHVSSVGSYIGYKDGTNVISNATIGTATNTNLVIGRYGQGESNYGNFSVPEIVVYSTALSVADRQTLEAYQKAFYVTP